jgi:hypothetical protein
VEIREPDVATGQLLSGIVLEVVQNLSCGFCECPEIDYVTIERTCLVGPNSFDDTGTTGHTTN